MKKLILAFMALLAVTVASAANAATRNMDIRCSKEIMNVGGVMKDVKVILYTDHKVSPSRYALSITTKPANSAARRSKPVPNDAVRFLDHVSILKSSGSHHDLITDDRKNGYDVIGIGSLFSSTTNDPCSSPIRIELIPVGEPSLMVRGRFDCSAVCDW